MKSSLPINEFIATVVARVSYKDAHNDIARELRSHFEDVQEQLTGVGLDDKAIEAEALRRMGSAEDVGTQLNGVHQPRTDWLLLAAVALLLVGGMFAMQRAGVLAPQLLWLGIGAVVCVGVLTLKPRHLVAAAVPLYLATWGIGLLGFFTGPRVAGQPYLAVGPLHITVVELSVVLFVVGLPGLLHTSRAASSARRAAVLTAALAPLVAYAYLASSAAATIYFVAVATMLLVSAQPRHAVIACSAVGGALLSLAFYRATFAGPAAYQALQQSERHTDFVFHFLQAQSPVLAAAIAIVALCLVVYLIASCSETKNPFSRTLMAGATAVLATGIVVGLASNIGFIPMPLTGINLPFLSNGGSMLVAHMALVAILVGIRRRKTIAFLT
ncbi:MAG TPA: FtsW/RodA/SpoVE family cell cycle protein [Kofleriaceae bacterium]|nr:FtsW/RodA/SpoVE family cell cycle protein [Kofleriaceae bacterium]